MAVTAQSWGGAAAHGPAGREPPVGPDSEDAPVDLDVAAAGAPEQVPPQSGGGAVRAAAPGSAGGTRGVAMALALAAAASLLTGIVVHHRAEAAAASAPPRLEVGYPEVRSRPALQDRIPRARVVLPVLNPGTEPLEVTAVGLTERAGPVSLERPDVRLEPGELTRLAVRTSPRCHAATTGEADVAAIVVRGAGGEHTVRTELAAPFGSPALDAQLQGLCASTGMGRPVDVAVSLLPDDRTLVMRMTNTSLEDTDLALWAPSASGIVSEPALPLRLGPGEEVSLGLTAAPRCETWSGGLPSMSVDVVSSRPPSPDGITRSTDRDVPSGWSALLTSWLGGQVARACDPP
jgi:hypothetical protein